MLRFALFLLIFLSACFCSFSQIEVEKDSISQVVRKVGHSYDRKEVSENEYLDSIRNIMQNALSLDIYFTNKELLDLLSKYRDVAWSSDKNLPHKIEYYGILANQAQMQSMDGIMLYNAQKIKELETAHSGQPSITALTIICSYYNSKGSYEHTQELYKKHRKFITSIPTLAAKDQINPRLKSQSITMLLRFGEGLYPLRDTVRGNEVLNIMQQLVQDIQGKSKNADEIYKSKYAIALVRWEKAVATNNAKLIHEVIADLDTLSKDKETPGFLRNYIRFALADRKVGLYLDQNKNDSALLFLNELDQLFSKKEFIYNAYMITKYKARALYQKGLYKQSVDTLVNALIILETYKSNIVQDISEMMYAQAKSEEQQLLLEEANKKSKTNQLILVILIAAIILSIIISVAWYRAMRRRQKAKFLEFKLNLARSIHDETNPALLYAKALLKSQNGSSCEITDLEKHIDHTMQLIRSLSHDLKSDKQYTIEDLIDFAKGSLKKINVDQTFRHTVNVHLNKSKFLSHFQFSQLKPILAECITNSIKHANFNLINIDFGIEKNSLILTYSDDGKGWKPAAEEQGIGLANIAERAELLNGDFFLQNNYPEGYKIILSVPLK